MVESSIACDRSFSLLQSPPQVNSALVSESCIDILDLAPRSAAASRPECRVPLAWVVPRGKLDQEQQAPDPASRSRISLLPVCVRPGFAWREATDPRRAIDMLRNDPPFCVAWLRSSALRWNGACAMRQPTRFVGPRTGDSSISRRSLPCSCQTAGRGLGRRRD